MCRGLVWGEGERSTSLQCPSLPPSMMTPLEWFNLQLANCNNKYVFQTVPGRFLFNCCLFFQNILFANGYRMVKVADFSLSRWVDKQGRIHKQLCTISYRSPQVLTMTDYKGKLADIWSLGVTILHCLLGFKPFYNPTFLPSQSVEFQRQYIVDFPDG